MSRVEIVTFAPIDYADSIRQAIGLAGAGVLGLYSYCSYSVLGKGRFLPSDSANPTIGSPGISETVEEERIEVTCRLEDAKPAIDALKKAHPYEEVPIDIYQLIEESEL